MAGETSASWDIPGGRINPEESLGDALSRELSEEIGLNSDIDPELIAAQDIFVKEKDLHVVRLTYRIDYDLNEIKLSEEHKEYKWVGLSEIQNLPIERYLKEVLVNLSKD
jgi:8-oxo-dGTP diphosphatase